MNSVFKRTFQILQSAYKCNYIILFIIYFGGGYGRRLSQWHLHSFLYRFGRSDGKKACREIRSVRTTLIKVGKLFQNGRDPNLDVMNCYLNVSIIIYMSRQLYL